MGSVGWFVLEKLKICFLKIKMDQVWQCVQFEKEENKCEQFYEIFEIQTIFLITIWSVSFKKGKGG